MDWETGDPGNLPSPSVEWLSLPQAMASGTDPLRGWSRFSTQRMVSEASVCVVEEGLSREGDSLSEVPAGLERVQLFGMIIEETAPLYCFYDPIRSEWFSLSTGEQNIALGIELVTGGDGMPPQLLDLKSGLRYPVQQGNWKLVLSDNQVPDNEEPFE